VDSPPTVTFELVNTSDDPPLSSTDSVMRVVPGQPVRVATASATPTPPVAPKGAEPPKK